MMKVRNVTVCTTLSEKDKNALESLANEWGLKPGIILRRLVLFFLQEKVNFLEILKKTSGISVDDKENKEMLFPLRTALTGQEKKQLIQIAKEWDFTVSAILRRLIKALLSDCIKKQELW